MYLVGIVVRITVRQSCRAGNVPDIATAYTPSVEINSFELCVAQPAGWRAGSPESSTRAYQFNKYNIETPLGVF